MSLRAVRISAAERDRALLELSEHLGTGRLTLTEFEQRSAAAVAATTSNELAELFADLPGAAHPPGDERIAIPWPACLVAAALGVTPPPAYLLHNALWLLLIPVTVGIRAIARRDRGYDSAPCDADRMHATTAPNPGHMPDCRIHMVVR